MSDAVAAERPSPQDGSAATGESEVTALYLHVPFCERRCEYCDFAAVAGLRRPRAYVEAVCLELRRLAAALGPAVLDSVFVGGGTPSFLPPELLAALLEEVRACFALAPDAEVTVEANPSSTTEARARRWLAAGVNRVSLGVQSLDRDTLRFLGRVHSASQALEALAALIQAGVPRISCDLIYAVPGLSDAAWQATVERVLEFGCGHLSAYELTVEAHTPLAEAVAAGRVHPIDEEAALRQHRMVVDLATGAGLQQYEVSNFARPGEECRHNLHYWRHHLYAAAGAGAHAHLPAAVARRLGVTPAGVDRAVAVRFWHVDDPDDYVAAVVGGGLGLAGAEAVEAPTADVERLLLGLRLAEGVALGPACAAEAQRLASLGLLQWDGRVARATPRGREVLDDVIGRLAAAL